MKVGLYVLSGVLVLAAAYCGLWFFSSASLACTACNCEYSLFHEHFRCRQPYLAILGVVFSLGLSIASYVMARRRTG